MIDQPPRQIVFVDTETSGLDDRRHRAWDLAWWNLTTGRRGQFFVHIPDMSKFMGMADPFALRVGRFLDRYPLDAAPFMNDTAGALDAMLEGIYPLRKSAEPPPLPLIIGSKPTFDLGFLRRLMLDYHHPDPENPARPRDRRWHHHPIDLGAYAAGVLGVEPGTSSLSAESVARLVGVDPGDHSAEGDVTSGGRSFLLLREAARRANRSGGPREAREFIDSTPLRHNPEMIEAELLRPPAVTP